MFGIVSPQDWGLQPARGRVIQPWLDLGVAADEWEERARKATYEWLMRNWQEDKGAFAGHCRIGEACFGCQLTNLVPGSSWRPMIVTAMPNLRKAGERPTGCTTTWSRHPMSVVVGAVAFLVPSEVWIKFGEFVILNLALYAHAQRRVCAADAERAVPDEPSCTGMRQV